MPTTPGCKGWTPATWLGAGSAGRRRRVGSPRTRPVLRCRPAARSYTGRAEQVKDDRQAKLAGIRSGTARLGSIHAVRTPGPSAAVARRRCEGAAQPPAVRHVTGDAGVSGPLRGAALDLWRATAPQAGSRTTRDLSARWRIAAMRRFPAQTPAEGRGRPGTACRSASYAARHRAARGLSRSVAGGVRHVCSTSRASCIDGSAGGDVLRRQRAAQRRGPRRWPIQAPTRCSARPTRRARSG